MEVGADKVTEIVREIGAKQPRLFLVSVLGMFLIFPAIR